MPAAAVGDRAQAEGANPEREAVMDHCPKCEALLDVSGCEPMTETSCPCCGGLIKVLREFHHFVLLSKLGSGGAGSVYRAYDETLERDVALKILRNEHTLDPAYVEGLESEAQIMASLNHAHILKVYSAGRKSGYFYIAMEIVSGGTLGELIKREGLVSEAAVLSYGIQIAEGLQAAFARGLLHRDIKPGNLLFTEAGAIKVGDFGLALPLDRAMNESGDIWGTPEYIAPEKLLGRGEDVRSDIYSLGCTLFHCLAGAPPLSLTEVMNVAKTQRAKPAPDIQSIIPTVSGAVAFVIKRCLELDPADRYQSYDEVIEHLHYAQDQGRPKAPAAGQPAGKVQAKEPSSEKRVFFGVAAALASCLILAGIYFGTRSDSKPESPGPESAKRHPVSEPLEAAPPVPAVRPPDPIPAVNTVYEAEDAIRTRQLGTERNHLGYSGSSFVAPFEHTGDTVTFLITVPNDGRYALRLRYANGSIGARVNTGRTLSLYVNSAKVDTVQLRPLPNWDNWDKTSTTVPLMRGPNTIMCRRDENDSGLVNLDYLEVVGPVR